MFDAAGRFYNVDPQLLKTVFHIESGGNVNTGPSYAGAIGPMQLMPKTAAYLGVTDPRNMAEAVPAAARYLREGLDAGNNNPEYALRYYNGGPRGVNSPATLPYVVTARNLYSNMSLQPGSASAAKSPTSDNSSTSLDNDYQSGLSILTGKKDNTSASDTKSSSDVPDNDYELGLKTLSGSATATAPDTTKALAQAPTIQPAPGSSSQPKTVLDQIVPNLANNELVSGIRNALQPGPNDYQFQGLGRFLPIAHDEATGQNRLAWPQAIQDLGTGGLDLLQGMRTGVVTPEATGALATAAMAGKLNASPVSPYVKNMPLPADVIEKNAKAYQEMTSNILSPEFKANPFSSIDDTLTAASGKSPTGSMPKGPTTPDINFKMPEDAPTPTADPNAKSTIDFANMLKDMLARHLKEKAIGSMIRGATAGHSLFGPPGAVAGVFIGPLLESALGKLPPGVKSAVMRNLGDYATPQTMMGGALNPMREYQTQDDQPPK